MLTRALLVGAAGWMLTRAPVLVPATILAGVCLATLATVPALAAAAAALAVPLGISLPLGVTGNLTTVPVLIAVGCVGLAGRLLFAGGRGVMSLRPASRAFAWVLCAGSLYACVLAVSSLAAPALEAAAVETARWMLFLLAMALAYGALREPWSRQVLATALLCAGGVASAIGLIWAVQGVGPPSYVILGGSLYRAFGTFGQPNPFGAYMNLVWPLGVGLLLARLQRASLDPVPTWLAALGAVAALATIAGLGASWSRGAWLASICAGLAIALVMLIRHARPPWPAWGLVATFATGALAIAAFASGPRALAPDALIGRISSAGSTFAGWEVADAEVTDANFATVERMAHWEAAVRMWSVHPWLGQGPGHYELAYERFRLPRWSEPLGHAHNYYLHALAESGLIGFTAYLAFLASLGAFAVRLALRAKPGSMAFASAIGLSGALAAVAMHSVVDNVFVHDMTVTLGLLTGLAAAAEATSRPSAASGSQASPDQATPGMQAAIG